MNDLNTRPLESYGLVRQGAATSDNGRFLKLWHEVSQATVGYGIADIEDAKQGGLKWFPYNKGGSFKKWYGNHEFLINYQNDGKELKEFQSTLSQGWTVRLKSREYYFKESVSWPKIASFGTFAARYYPAGFIFDVAGCCFFPASIGSQKSVVAFLNSNVAEVFLKILSPTVNFEIEHVKRIPFVPIPNNKLNFLEHVFEIARADWDNFETSWDFRDQPLLRPGLKGATLEASWRNWEARSTAAIRRMQELETENNRLFIAAYGLDGELQPEVPEEQITLARAEARRDMADFLSYAVGCMFGRYSLDKQGLILANQGDTLADYLRQVPEPRFRPDADNVIPLLDGDWFTDDIAGRFRQFLRVAFGEAHYEENLRFVEQGLNSKGRRNYGIRDYFLGEFYTDHVKRYKKRPIYWLFSSPKGSFNALIYMHRYRPDTVSVVLNDYLREFRTKLTAHKRHLEAVSISASASQGEKTKALKEIDKITKIIAELEEYEREVLYPLATQQLAIDLDDGVKVNYLKFGPALKKIVGLEAKED